MRWVIAGLLFALAVSLAIATAAIRAGNVVRRRQIEDTYRKVDHRTVERQRLRVAVLEAASPERLAELHWQCLRQESERVRAMQERRQGDLQ